jgi:hypothetical protein
MALRAHTWRSWEAFWRILATLLIDPCMFLILRVQGYSRPVQLYPVYHTSNNDHVYLSQRVLKNQTLYKTSHFTLL